MAYVKKQKQCVQCGKVYLGTKKQKFCSKLCVGNSYKKRIVIQCAVCGIAIEARPAQIGRKKYCSNKCMDIGQKRQNPVTCKVCNKIFYLTPSESIGRIYCSNKCHSVDHHLENSNIVICHYCKKQIERPNSRIGKNKKSYCSRKCRYLDIRKPEIHVILTCATCGKQYETTTHQIRKRNSRYCSVECQNNGTRTRPIAKAYFWRKITKKIRERDEYTCQLCGKLQISPSLHVHHIVPDRMFSPDILHLANSETNLISLCSKCHRMAESNPTLNALCQSIALSRPRLR